MFKRILLILAIVSSLVLLTVPAFADTLPVPDFMASLDDDNDWHYPGKVPEGRYFLLVDYDNDSGSYSSTGKYDCNFVISYSDNGEDLVYYGSFQLTDSISGEVVTLNVEVQYCIEANLTYFYFSDTDGSCDDSVSVVEFYRRDDPDPAPGADDSVGAIFGIFTGIGGWLIAQLGSVSSLFYQAESGLTLLGVLAVCSVGIVAVLGLISLIRNWLRFRG